MKAIIKCIAQWFLKPAIITNYLFRALSHLVAIVIVVVQHNERHEPLSNFDYISISILLVAPHLLFWLYVASVEYGISVRNTVIDFFVLGWVIVVFDFSLLPSGIYTIAIICNYISLVGFRRLHNILLIPLGAVVSAYFGGFKIDAYSSYLITYISLSYGAFHFIMLSYNGNVYSRKQREARRLIQDQNEKINEQSQEILAQSEELATLNESLMELNTSLEGRVAQRTKEVQLKNKKLAEFAFFNAHILRAPIANIIGLMRLFKSSTPEEYDGIVGKLESSILKVDDRVRHIMTKLEADDLDNDEDQKYTIDE